MSTISVFQLSSGMTIIGRIAQETTEYYVLSDPLEMSFEFVEETGATEILVQRWMPFSNNNETIVFRSSIEGMTLASEEFGGFYIQQVTRFKEPAKTTRKRTPKVLH